MQNMKYSDFFTKVLVDLGYSHCFFVAGGNIMHLIESLSKNLVMIPVVNEVASVISAEYFNEVSRQQGNKALALVTAGPGVTNAITGIAGAFTESREVLVVGGQVKSADLSRGELRQRGIQEIDGIALTSPITVRTLRIESPISQVELIRFLHQGESARKGPLFIEFCLDAQNQPSPDPYSSAMSNAEDNNFLSPENTLIDEVSNLLQNAKRPVLLIGSGINLNYFPELLSVTKELGIPLLTSWNAADRVASDVENYFGRPNNWGQRHSNLILQQSDLLIAAGTRLGFQQTGFNYEEFAPLAKIVHIDIDSAEIHKGHPRVDIGIVGDAMISLREIFERTQIKATQFTQWLSLCKEISKLVPVPDPLNICEPQYVEVFDFIHQLSDNFGVKDVVIPCSSGGGSTVTMQVVKQKGLPQRIVTNKGMASMGYGLPGAIGACFARPNSRVWLVDGDGGFIQNTQELGVIGQFQLNLKIFLISNNGYASIRSTQKNYFDGHYVGCDPNTGLQLPNWEALAKTYGINFVQINHEDPFSKDVQDAIDSNQPTLFIIPVDPEQTFYPKIQSRISEKKGMESNPLHEMTPLLDRTLLPKVAPHLIDFFNIQ
jgi:acetolactate synthase-1/2/3 large subunit